MTDTPNRSALLDSPVWLGLAWIAAGIFAIALGALMVLGRWHEFRIASCFFAPLVVVLLSPHGLPNILLAAIAGCFLVSGAGWALDWYSQFWWFDVVMHGLNPLVIVAASMFMFWKADLASQARAGRFVLLAAAYGVALGIAWELFELTYLRLTWPDTILDVVMDGAGAALGGWLALWVIARRGGLPVGRRRLPALPGRPLREDRR